METMIVKEEIDIHDDFVWNIDVRQKMLPTTSFHNIIDKSIKQEIDNNVNTNQVFDESTIACKIKRDISHKNIGNKCKYLKVKHRRQTTTKEHEKLKTHSQDYNKNFHQNVKNEIGIVEHDLKVDLQDNSSDGSPGVPKLTDTISKDHFFGVGKYEEDISPSCIPTIFPLVYKRTNINEKTSKNKLRIAKDQITIMTTATKIIPQRADIIVSSVTDVIDQCEQADEGCQVDFLPNSNQIGKTFTCSRYMYVGDNRSDAEIQTEIIEAKTQIIINRKKYKDKACNTPIRDFNTQSR